jgi:hypothetical protein
MTTARAILGGILLFLGREINFLFAGGMAALIGFRLLPLLPPGWPGWADMVFIGVLTVIAGVVPLINERAGYVVSGFLFGGYFFSEYFAPGASMIPLLPFLIGSVMGAIIMGIFTDWALMIISSMFGAFYSVDLFTLTPTAKMLVGGGLFLAGALTQVIMRRMQQE